MPLFKRNRKHAYVTPNQVFLDGSDRYEPGHEYRVDIAKARYFDRNGWLEGSNLWPSEPVDLEVDNASLNSKGGF